MRPKTQMRQQFPQPNSNNDLMVYEIFQSGSSCLIIKFRYPQTREAGVAQLGDGQTEAGEVWKAKTFGNYRLSQTSTSASSSNRPNELFDFIVDFVKCG